jgi:hypothetical protein
MRQRTDLARGLFRRGRSPYGVDDLVGSVWEWVFDWYLDDAYAGSRSANPRGPSRGYLRVVKGGGWVDGAEAGVNPLRISNRYSFRPDLRFVTTGFRCAKGGEVKNVCLSCGEGALGQPLLEAVQSNARHAADCYRQELRDSQQPFEGTASVTLKIGDDGTVCGLSPVGLLPGPLSSCLLAALDDAAYPPPDRGCVVVKVPFSFSIKDTPPSSGSP